MNGVYNMNFSAGNARELIDGRFLEHEKLVHRVMGSKKLMKDLEDAAGLMKMTLLSGNKIMFCGNGGSAADAQHWAAEIVGRFQKERAGMAGLALTTDTSILTAVGNDYGYDRVFSRQVEGLGREGDLLHERQQQKRGRSHFDGEKHGHPYLRIYCQRRGQDGGTL